MKNVLFAIAVLFLIEMPVTASPIQKGIAVVYPAQSQGKKLPTGETLRHDRLTAAHPSIDLGTVVRVTNMSNHLRIDLLINDRSQGPSEIVLTPAAASMLGMRRGVSTQVEIEPLSHPVARGVQTEKIQLPAAAPNHTSQPANHGLYFLEFATYKNIIQAKLLAFKLTKRGAPSKVVQDLKGQYHVISDGYFTSLDDASKAYHLVNENVGYTAVIKQI